MPSHRCRCGCPRSTRTGTPAGYPSGHVHGLSVDPETSRILLATHDGLFGVTQSPALQIGYEDRVVSAVSTSCHRTRMRTRQPLPTHGVCPTRTSPLRMQQTVGEA
ncbi:hypothetical protein C4K88_07655 [Arthrobacter pityocampae]|uniref:Uncharacterized protein n=1 Tax=Arthrobacter pityocampae TaxID=547334 RepID=A0A2S5IYC9_9MICC|nr:hypothetical protein C4K88_07655 [Arthrobacter pityocampae]